MKETIDPNRSYNRTEIDKVFEKIKAEKHKEALARGQAKYNDNKALCQDGYSGTELRGGDAYEYDHVRSAEEIFNKYKGTHSDKQIAQIVNHPSNIKATSTDINRFKGKYRFEDKLKNEARVKELGINSNRVKKALKNADLDMSILAAKLSGGFFNVISAFFKSIIVFIFSFWKFILIAITAILLIVLFLKLYELYGNSQGNVSTEKKTELKEVQKTKINTTDATNTDSKITLSFAKPLDDLTKSVTNISVFNSILENENTIPVIGLLFEYNSTTISTNGKAVLTRFSNEYKKLDTPNRIIIEGFTCTIGSKESNENLGKERADNLKAELIGLGISEDAITVKGIGLQNFVSTDNIDNDLVLNRRSNVTILATE